MPPVASVAWVVVAAILVIAAVLLLRALLRLGPVKRLRRRLRTARAQALWARPADVVVRPVASKVVVTMTASPDRLAGMDRTVRTLLNQSCPPDEIHLNIPHRFLRTGEAYEIPGWCGSLDPRIRVFRVDDIGPATKSVPTVERLGPDEDVVIVIADDDVLYLQESLEVLLREVASDRRAAYGFSGYDFGTNWESILARGRSGVEVIEGWACIAVHRSCFGVGYAAHMARANESRACFCHDDVVMSSWLESRGVRRVQVHDASVNRRRMRKLGAQLDFGYLPGALHQESPGAARAREAARHLASFGAWHLRSPAPDAVAAAP
jgi:hypothetical protein